MKVLITGGSSRLARAIASELGKDHRIRLMDGVPFDPEGGAEGFRGSLLDPDDVWKAVRGIDAVIHTAEPPPSLPAAGLAREQALLEWATRGTHVLLKAGVEAGVRRFLYAGTLEIFSTYPDEFYISERWKPQPTPDIEVLSRYLGELVCREFTRDHLISATALRLGKLVRQKGTAGQSPDPMWLDERDAARAFRCALSRDSSREASWARRWSVVHICSNHANPRYLSVAAERMGYRPEHSFPAPEEASKSRSGAARKIPSVHPRKPTKKKVKKVLLLGASGLIAPHIIPGLEKHYDLRLADLKPHPDGRRIRTVDVTDYAQVRNAARGMDAIMNFTVNRPHPVLSFSVNTLGAYHVMKAAAELGIRKVLHSGPELIIPDYRHEFDLGDVPQRPGSGYYFITKFLAMEICRTFAQAFGIQTPCFQFNGLGPKPTAHVSGQDFPPFTIVWEDLVHACRLALDIPTIPDDFQAFNLHSYLPQGKYSIDKARRILGYEPLEPVEKYYRRKP